MYYQCPQRCASYESCVCYYKNEEMRVHQKIDKLIKNDELIPRRTMC